MRRVCADAAGPASGECPNCPEPTLRIRSERCKVEPVPSEVIGREQELAELTAHLAAVHDLPAVLLLEGEPGSGRRSSGEQVSSWRPRTVTGLSGRRRRLRRHGCPSRRWGTRKRAAQLLRPSSTSQSGRVPKGVQLARRSHRQQPRRVAHPDSHSRRRCCCRGDMEFPRSTLELHGRLCGWCPRCGTLDSSDPPLSGWTPSTLGPRGFERRPLPGYRDPKRFHLVIGRSRPRARGVGWARRVSRPRGERIVRWKLVRAALCLRSE